MPKYDNILTNKAARELITNQIGKALYNLDPTRSVYKNYRDVPPDTVYSLMESQRTVLKNMSYGEDTYYDDVEEVYKTDTVVSRQWSFRISAADQDPEDFLTLLQVKRWQDEWHYEFFGQHNIGVIEVGDVEDFSIAVVNEDWQVQYGVTLVVGYLSKETEIINTIETITGSIGVDDGDISESFLVELDP